MELKQIRENLIKSWDNPSSEEQLDGINQAIKELDKNSKQAGVNCEFLINLRDYLLDTELKE